VNYEILLINSVIESQDVATVIDQNATDVFSEYSDVWNYIVEFNNEYGGTPSKDVLKKNFKEFEFVKCESPLQYYIDDAKKQSLNKGIRTTLFKATEMLKDHSDPLQVLRLLQNEALELTRNSGRMTDTNMVDWQERADILRERIDHPDDMAIGVPSGISVIDAHFGGWQPGDFVVVIGWTGVGKSALTRLFAANAWRAGYSPLIISLEMDKLQEQYRMDTILNAGEVFTNTQLTNGIDINFDEYKGWAENEFEGKHPLHLVTAEGIESADQHFVQAKIDQYRKPPLIILDYHTLFDDAKGGGSEVERAKNLSKAFKRIAVKNRIAVIDVSAVTMDDGHDERPPLLNEIAWSKQLSYDADMVLAVHRSAGSDIFQVVTRKTRRCAPFAFYLRWNLDSGQWKEIYEHEATE
jgi:replicative DNA helicase